MDFDDLLVNTVALLREHPDVLEEYRRRFEHILVDEYQDTNQAQNTIVLLLAGGHGNVTVVGDTDQCLPAGTPIGTPSGVVPIESLRVGDVVTGTNGHHEVQRGAGHVRSPFVDDRTSGRSSARRPATAATSCGRRRITSFRRA